MKSVWVFLVGKHVRVLMLGSGYNQTLRKGIPMSLNGFIDYSLYAWENITVTVSLHGFFK